MPSISNTALLQTLLYSSDPGEKGVAGSVFFIQGICFAVIPFDFDFLYLILTVLIEMSSYKCLFNCG